MAAFETTRTAPFGAITTLKIVQAFETALHRISTWNDARVTRNALSKLTDRELDDIGLCRADLERLDLAQRD